MTLALFTPVPLMRPGNAATVDDALAQFGTDQPVIVEAHLDGLLIQAHMDGEEVRIFDANGVDITNSWPHAVANIRDIDADRLIIDGVLSTIQDEVQPFFYDALLINDQDLRERPLLDRLEFLAEVAPARLMVQRTLAQESVVVKAFIAHVKAQVHPAVNFKKPDAGYLEGVASQVWLQSPLG